MRKALHMIQDEKCKKMGIPTQNHEETFYNTFVDIVYENVKKQASDIETFMKQAKPPYKLDILSWTE